MQQQQTRHVLSNTERNLQRARQQGKSGLPRVPLQKLNKNNQLKHSENSTKTKLLQKPKNTSEKNNNQTNDANSNRDSNKNKNTDSSNSLCTIYEDSELPKLPKNVEDIDNQSLEANQKYFETYANGMDTIKENYFYLLYKQDETKISPEFPYNPPNFTTSTRLVDTKMRVTLLDWLLNCCEKLQLLPQTMYQGVWILDRFIDECNSPQKRKSNENKIKIDKTNLQLVGIASFVVASKYEENEYPMLDDWVFLSADSVSKKDIMDMELHILKAIDFNVSTPTPIQFLRRFSHIVQANQEVHTIAKYFLESTIYCSEMSKINSSDRALACLVIAGKLRDKEFWNLNLEYYSQTCESDLVNTIGLVSKLLIKLTCDIVNRQNKKCKTVSVFKKYSKEHNYEVATKRNVVGVRIRGESDLLQRNEKMTDGHIIKIASNCIVRINPVLNNLSKMK